MKRKNALWLSLVLSISLAGTALHANAAQQKDASPSQDTQAAPPHLDSAERDAQRTISGPYRLTYTVTAMDGSRRIGSQRYAIVLDAGREHGPAHLQLGTKIPIETAQLDATPQPQTQISYIDTGTSIQASLLKVANGLDLSTHISQSAVDSQQSLTKEPVIRNASFDSYVLLNEDKPLIIGTVAIPGTTHVLQIQVELSRIP